ncbi:hypothetical protein N9077_01730 [bacterium]|nr:hypothetical protein [bacterium]
MGKEGVSAIVSSPFSQPDEKKATTRTAIIDFNTPADSLNLLDRQRKTCRAEAGQVFEKRVRRGFYSFSPAESLDSSAGVSSTLGSSAFASSGFGSAAFGLAAFLATFLAAFLAAFLAVFLEAFLAGLSAFAGFEEAPALLRSCFRFK